MVTSEQNKLESTQESKRNREIDFQGLAEKTANYMNNWSLEKTGVDISQVTDKQRQYYPASGTGQAVDSFFEASNAFNSVGSAAEQASYQIRRRVRIGFHKIIGLEDNLGIYAQQIFTDPEMDDETELISKSRERAKARSIARDLISSMNFNVGGRLERSLEEIKEQFNKAKENKDRTHFIGFQNTYEYGLFLKENADSLRAIALYGGLNGNYASNVLERAVPLITDEKVGKLLGASVTEFSSTNFTRAMPAYLFYRLYESGQVDILTGKVTSEEAIKRVFSTIFADMKEDNVFYDTDNEGGKTVVSLCPFATTATQSEKKQPTPTLVQIYESVQKASNGEWTLNTSVIEKVVDDYKQKAIDRFTYKVPQNWLENRDENFANFVRTCLIAKRFGDNFYLGDSNDLHNLVDTTKVPLVWYEKLYIDLSDTYDLFLSIAPVVTGTSWHDLSIALNNPANEGYLTHASAIMRDKRDKRIQELVGQGYELLDLSDGDAQKSGASIMVISNLMTDLLKELQRGESLESLQTKKSYKKFIIYEGKDYYYACNEEQVLGNLLTFRSLIDDIHKRIYPSKMAIV